MEKKNQHWAIRGSLLYIIFHFSKKNRILLKEANLHEDMKIYIGTRINAKNRKIENNMKYDVNEEWRDRAWYTEAGVRLRTRMEKNRDVIERSTNSLPNLKGIALRDAKAEIKSRKSHDLAIKDRIGQIMKDLEDYPELLTSFMIGLQYQD